MELYHINADIGVFYVEAPSFPDGVPEAHQRLRAMLPSVNGRKFYGISYPSETGEIMYKAAVEEAHTGEAEKYGCKAFVIKSGNFISEFLTDWEKDVSTVAKTFEKLLACPGIAGNGYCLEVYEGKKDMRCMVPLDLEAISPEKENLLLEIDNTFAALGAELSLFDDGQINKVPFAGSWTAGQVAEHLAKSIAGLPDKNTGKTQRPYNEKVEVFRKLFLDFNIKMKSPGFAGPSNGPHDKKELLNTFEKIRKKLGAIAVTLDLTETCLDFELPTFGLLTRFEWIRFFIVHAQRHTLQLKNIRTAINNQ